MDNNSDNSSNSSSSSSHADWWPNISISSINSGHFSDSDNSTDSENHRLEGANFNEDKYIRNQEKIMLISLHDSISNLYKKIVEYELERGASITKESDIKWESDDTLKYSWQSWNALEVAIIVSSTWPSDDALYIYQKLEEKSLELFSSFGFHLIHLESARGNLSEVLKYIEEEPSFIDKKIGMESTIWAVMTPLLLAAKFDRRDIVNKLLDLGASPKNRGPKGSTALHYLTSYAHFDERLFIYDEKDTFDELTGLSHFLIACLFGSATIDIVKTYLKQGGLINQQSKCEAQLRYIDTLKGYTALHIAGNTISRYLFNRYDQVSYPKLTRLLLEYGADVNLRYDTNIVKSTPIHSIALAVNDESHNRKDTINTCTHICTLLEGGDVLNGKGLEWVFESVIKNAEYKVETSKMLLECIIRIITLLGEAADTKNLRYYYKRILRKSNVYFDEIAYTDVCQNELQKLSKLGLRRVLDDNATVSSDFKQRFEALVDSSKLHKLYPNYGHLLKIKLRNRLFEYEEKNDNVKKSVPLITFLVKRFCKLPLTCAYEILWNLSNKDLLNFIEIFRKIQNLIS